MENIKKKRYDKEPNGNGRKTTKEEIEVMGK